MVESAIKDVHLTLGPMSILNVSMKRSRSLSRHFPYSRSLAWSAAGVEKPHDNRADPIGKRKGMFVLFVQCYRLHYYHLNI